MALITLSSSSLLLFTDSFFLILKELDIEPLGVGAFVNRDGLASVDLLTLGMLEKSSDSNKLVTTR